MKLYELIELKPFSVKKHGNELIIKLAHHGLSIKTIRSQEIYYFTPIQASEIRIDLETKTFINIKDEFTFNYKERFIRIPLIALTFYCVDIIERVFEIVENYQISEQMPSIIAELEQLNIQREIDRYLALRDFETCRKLVMLCNNSTSMASH